MADSITKKFSQSFDVKNPEHVMWLRSLHEATLDEKSPNDLMKGNPFGIKVSSQDILEWVNIMFVLAMKYAMEVLSGHAWIPPQESTI
jgi:hypothetical protein